MSDEEKKVSADSSDTAEEAGTGEALDIDFSVCCPKKDAPAEPYHAIMKIGDDGAADGTLWGQGEKLMLFDDTVAARKILEALNNPGFELRGVTAAHLVQLKKLADAGRAELFVIVGFTANGSVEAMPLAEHEARVSKAGNPPPIRKHS